MKYAIIETGGKQYRVEEGASLRVEKIPGEKGQNLEFTRILAIGGEENTQVGSPTVAGAKVTAEIVQTARDKKIIVFKKKRRKGYKKKQGHRQDFTEVKIKEISA